jgi:hypothetical protein
MADPTDACGICLELFADIHVLRLKCGHHFHTTCVADWLVEHATCPLCRKLHRKVARRERGFCPYEMLFIFGLSLTLFLAFVQFYLVLFHVGVFVRGICRLDQQATELAARLMAFLSHLLSFALFIAVELNHYLQREWGRVYLTGLRDPNLARTLTFIAATLHVISLAYTIVVEADPPLPYYYQFCLAMHLYTMESVSRIALDASLMDMSWGMWLSVIIVSLSIGGGAT